MSQSMKSKLQVIFKWLGILFAISIAVQVFLAGVAVFVDAGFWSKHVSFVRYFGATPIVMLIISLVSRMPSNFRKHSIGLLFMIILMFLTAIFSSKISYLSALHPVIALMLMVRTFYLVQETVAHLNASKQNVAVSENA